MENPPMLSRTLWPIYFDLWAMALFHGYFPWGTPNQNIRKGFLLPEDQKKNWVSDLKKRQIPTYLNISLANMGDNYDTDGISDMP